MPDSNPRQHVLVRFLHILVRVVAATCAVTLAIAGMDLTVSALLADHPAPSSLFGVPLLWIPGVWLIPSAFAAAILSLGILILSASEDDPEEAVERAVAKFHGPRGRLLPTVIWLVVLVVMYLAITFFVHSELDPLTEIPLAVALLVAGTLTAPMIWLLHRLVAWRRPRGAAHPVAMGFAYLLITLVTIGGPIREVHPPLMQLGLICVSLVSGYVASLIMTRNSPRILAVLALCFVSFGATVVTVDDTRVPHEWASRHMYFHQAALGISQTAFDFDFDGHPGWMGGRDCDDLDPSIHPQAIEVVDNGIDDNCIGGDLADWDGPPVEFVTPKRMGGLVPVIFITVDTLRHDYIGRTINGRPLTPNIDALATDAWRFPRAYAPSTNTHESLPATMTGRYPADWRQSGVVFGLDQTLAEDLRALGYQTSAVLTMTSPTEALAWGFERVRARIGVINDSKIAVNSEPTTDEALRALDEIDLDQAYFLWVHYFDPHGKYMPRPDVPDWLPDDEVGRYAREVYATDRAIGRLVAEMKARGIFDKALIVFFSDHGEGLGDQGIHWHLREGSETIVRVPWFIRVPGAAPTATLGPTSLVRLRPTLHQLLGLETPGMQPPLQPGVSQAPVFVASNPHKKPGLWIAIDGDWKLVHDRQRVTWSLHDLSRDPDELLNLVETEPEKFREMRELMGDWRDETYNSEQLDRKSKRYPTRQRYRPEYLEGMLHETSKL